MRTAEELIRAAEAACAEIDRYSCRVLVCSGTGCIATGSNKIHEIFEDIVKDAPGVELVFSPCGGHDDEKVVGVKKTGYQGFCELGPLVRIQKNGRTIQYVRVQPEDCQEIFEQSVLGDEVIERLLYHKGETAYVQPDQIPFIAKQTRIVLENCGRFDAESLDEYLAAGGFSALRKAMFELGRDGVIDEVDKSGLRGRGSGGFPAGKKWKQVARQKEQERYVVCNGDEGDPGAFMDGSVMEGDPFKLIEGMMIAGYAVKAENGYIYVRAEYPMSVARLWNAIHQLEDRGLLGDNILGTDFNFHLHINKGAGAFVCGEGSALTASIEGNRGMPRTKPPRTVEKGLWEKPTVLNNVETYANVPKIILEGADWFRSIGTPGSPGCKTFSLTGAIENTGLIEVPMGSTLRQIIFDIGGGLKDGKEFKAVQIGDPSGGCLTEAHLDEPLDFDSVKKFNVIFGASGGVTEAVLRRLVEGHDVATLESIAQCGVRGDGIKEFIVPYNGIDVSICVASGLANARKVLESVKSGEKNYHFIEIMACPGGCVMGGGQPTDGTKVQRAQTRTTGLYAADGDMAIKKSNENPLMDVFYNSPMAAKAHDLLHNHH